MPSYLRRAAIDKIFTLSSRLLVRAGATQRDVFERRRSFPRVDGVALRDNWRDGW